MRNDDCCFSVTPADNRDHLAVKPLYEGLSPVQGAAIEGWITFILILAILGSTNARRKKEVYMPAIPIGFSVAAGIFATVST